MLLAQYTEKGGLSLGGLFNGLKVNTKDFEDIINEFKQIEDFDKYLDNGVINWDNLSKSIGITDTRLRSYLETLDDGKGHIDNTSASVEGMSAYLEKSGNGFQFAAIKATLFNAALNAGIMLLASFVVDGVIKAWDKMNLTVEEQTAKVNELKSSYEGLKSEYDTLSQKQDITDAEKRRLEYLERRLELDERILKAEQKQLFDEKTGTKFTDWFDKDNYNVQYAKETSIDRINTNPDNFAFLSRLYDKKMDDIKATQEQITEWTKYRDAVAEGSDEWNVYQSHIDDAQNRQTSAMKDLDDSANQMTVNLGKYADNIEYFEEQLASGDLSEEETAIAQAHLNNWQELYNSTERMIAEIQKLNGTYDYTNEHMSRSIRSISDNHGISDRDQYTQLEEYTKDFTDEQKQLWLEVTKGAENATRAIEMYEAALSDAQQQANETPVSLSVSDTIEQLNTQLKPAFDSLKSAYQDIFTDDGFTLENVDTSMLSSIKSAIDELNKMEDIDINVDYSSFEDLAKVLTDSSSTAEDVQNAFNSLATEIVNSTSATAGMTDETRNMVVQLLESLGVTNAEELAMYALSEAKAEAFLASYDLANATQDEITAMLAEAESAGIATDMIFKLVAEEQVFNNQGLSVEGKVQELKKLAEAYGQTAVAAKIARMEDEYTKSHQPINYEEIAKAAQAEINNAVNSVHVDFSGLGKGAKSAGSKAGKDFKDGLKEQLSDLDSVISGVTSRIDDNIEAVRTQKEEAVAAIDAQIDALNEQKSALEDQKKALEEERDARIEIIEQQKKQLELAIKAIDKQIKQKEKVIKGIEAEIKAMKDANEQRKREIDLQKAQFELEKMQNMRTKLVK